MPELHPALVLLVGAAVVAALPRRLAAPFSLAVGLATLVALASLEVGTTMTYGFYGYELTILRYDALAVPFAFVFGILSVVAGVYGWSTMGRLERAAAMATAGAGIGVVLAGDLLTLFFFWELKVSAAVLLVLARRRARSRSAAVRYLFVHLAGGVVLLGGILWWLLEEGTLVFERFEMTGAAWLILIGVLTSAAVPPLNAWLPDAYPESTVAGTVVLSAFTTKSAVYALARGFPGLELLLWLGVAMAIFGVIYAILEDDIRRLLCYHIISQVGFMVAAIGVGTEIAIAGATAHAVSHVLYKGLLLMGAGVVLHATGRSRASELGGLARALPWALALYMVGAASISGVPLFSGFAAKELATTSISAAHHEVAYQLLKLAAVGTFLSVFLKLPASTWLGTARGSTKVSRVPVPMYAAMGFLAALNVAIGIAPRLLYRLMPTDVDFSPFTLAKVLGQLDLMVLTTVGFLLLRRLFAPKGTELLDTDWVYRELPALAAPAAVRATDRLGRVAEASARARRRVGASLMDVRSRVQSILGTGEASSGDLGQGWLLGCAVLSAVVVVLAVGVFG